MKKEITILQLEYLLEEMKRLQIEHPNAVVLYDVERTRIEITYPLPKDFPKNPFQPKGDYY